jgi:hypothetical protein
LKQRGILTFVYDHEDRENEVYIFECTKFSGEPMETTEMRPQWFDYADVPYENMWPNDRIWLPMFMEGLDLSGRFVLDEDKQVISYEINEVKAE